MKKCLGGWSMDLSGKPLDEFDVMMYGMVTNLQGLSTGTPSTPGWSPEKKKKPENNNNFKGKTLWVYGGGGCSPQGKPSDMHEVERLVEATLNSNWDGVDFDDECQMNIPLVTEAMKRLKEEGKETSFGFISGSVYNNPESSGGHNLNEKVKEVIVSGHCDRLIHYCYAASMWSDNDIRANVRQALQRSISNGMSSDKIVLALTSRGLTDWNLNYFIDQVLELDLNGLYIWAYDKLTPSHLEMIKQRLKNS